MLKEKYTEEELSKSFEEALEKGELTDLMGNKLGEIDLIEYDIEGENALTYQQVMSVMKGLQGKILTITDATFTDEKRLKFVKDLIKNAFSNSADFIFTLSTDKIEKAK